MSTTAEIESWENEGGACREAEQLRRIVRPLSAVELAICEEFWAMLAEIQDAPPALYARDIR